VELRRLRDDAPKEASLYYLIGRAHKKQGRLDQAVHHFQLAHDLDPKGGSQYKQAIDTIKSRDDDDDVGTVLHE